MTGSALTDLAQASLAAIVAHWPAVNDPDWPDLARLPARQYVTVGTPASDCEQLVVAVERTFGNEGNPAIERIVPIGSGVPYLRAMVVAVQILRCITTIEMAANEPVFPAPAAMQADADAILSDADAVLACLIAAQKADELAGCGGMALENWRAVTAEGGFAGGVTRIRINLF